MSAEDSANTSWQAEGSQAHACHCIGCCKECGCCRTAPWHTHDYCELLQRQERERRDMIESQRTDGITPGLEYGTY